jgi:hypothetical protein
MTLTLYSLCARVFSSRVSPLVIKSLAVYWTAPLILQCGGGGTWGSFVSPTMADEDPSRPIWPACPSSGWKSGVDRLTGLPNGKPLVLAKAAAVSSSSMGSSSLVLEAATASSLDESDGVEVPVKGERTDATCASIKNVDYGKGEFWLSPKAKDAGECCDECAKQEGCVVGVLYAGVCYMKNATMATKAKAAWGQGTIAVWVPGTTPIKPKIGGCNTGLQMETHGYCAYYSS